MSIKVTWEIKDNDAACLAAWVTTESCLRNAAARLNNFLISLHPEDKDFAVAFRRASPDAVACSESTEDESDFIFSVFTGEDEISLMVLERTYDRNDRYIREIFFNGGVNAFIEEYKAPDVPTVYPYSSRYITRAQAEMLISGAKERIYNCGGDPSNPIVSNAYAEIIALSQAIPLHN